ncbi:MAG: TlpA disulfide reductase family protein [Candidatus Zixiibacteriota bacterium]
MNRRWIRLFLFISVSGLLALVFGSSCSEKADSGFKVFDIEGKLHSSSEWIGRQPVVISFWGTWCGPCRKEIPDLVKLYNEYSPRGVEILGLAVRDHPDRIRRFTQQFGVNWVMLMADTDVVLRYNATTGIPTTIFLDRDGKEVMRYVGARPYEMLKKGFDAITAG